MRFMHRKYESIATIDAYFYYEQNEQFHRLWQSLWEISDCKNEKKNLSQFIHIECARMRVKIIDFQKKKTA